MTDRYDFILVEFPDHTTSVISSNWVSILDDDTLGTQILWPPRSEDITKLAKSHAHPRAGWKLEKCLPLQRYGKSIIIFSSLSARLPQVREIREKG